MKDYIGAYVKQFESGSKGCRCLTQCGNDWGLSCGSYQLTLRWGNCISFLKKYFPELSKDLYFHDKGDFASPKFPGVSYCSTPTDVKKVWNLCIETVGEEKFFEYEHDYIRNNYYEPLMKKLVGLFNPNTHSRALQECLWSWSVHKGYSGAYLGMKQIANGYNVQKENVISLLNRIYDYRYQMNKYDRFSKSKSSERKVLLDIANMKPLAYEGTQGSNGTKYVSEFKPYLFIQVADDGFLNIRSGPGITYPIVSAIRDKKKYTIVEEKGNWGRLKSGIGWVSLSYIKKV